MLTRLKKIDQILLPKRKNNKYTPYIWLVYLLFFFVSLGLHNPVKNSFVYASLGTLLFLIIYFHAHWASNKYIHWNIIGINIIASSLSQLSPSASVFFVYAAAFCCLLGTPKKAFIGLVIIAIWIGVLAWFTHLAIFFYGPAILFTFIVGGVNIYQHEVSLKQKELILSQQEVRHLARTSERERISRDLHDLIGHTFSIITLKAELANKLIDKDINKAKAEITALEHISRDALSQIREVVSGYRTSDLNTELAHAKYVLESNDICFNYQFPEFKMSEHINQELSIMLKELVTNILKHAQANKVNVSIQHKNNHVIFQIKDNGIGLTKSHFTQSNVTKAEFTHTQNTQTDNTGFGLTGITERVKKLDGNITFKSLSGTEITIKTPLLESL